MQRHHRALGIENGLYAGTWASNVTFSNAAIEVDYYAGFAGAFNEDVEYDVGLLWYNYPKDGASPDLDYVEIYGSVAMMGGYVLGEDAPIFQLGDEIGTEVTVR